MKSHVIRIELLTVIWYFFLVLKFKLKSNEFTRFFNKQK